MAQYMTLAQHLMAAQQPPRTAMYSRAARNRSYARRMMLMSGVPGPPGGPPWVLPLPPPPPPRRHR